MAIKVIEKPFAFYLTFEWNQQIIDAVKAVPGRQYIPEQKAWSIPTELRSEVDILLQTFGGEIATEVKVNYDIPELPELDVEIPQLKRPLFPFQAKGVAYGLQKKRLIIGDKPGLGKTAQAIALITAAGAFPCVVVCPSTLKENWKREWEIVAGEKAMILTPSIKSSWQTFYKVGMCRVFIVNYESLKKYFVVSTGKKEGGKITLKSIEWDERIKVPKSVIADEIHKAKDGKTQQTKFLIGLARDKEWVVGLSGTPVVNKPKDLVSQLAVIGQLNAVSGGYKNFISRYCGADGNGSSNLQELRYKLATTCFYQREKKDVLHDLPDKIRQIITCDIANRNEYNAAINSLSVYLKEYREKTDEQIRRAMRGEVMVRIGVCKNISARGKLAEVYEYIDEIIDSGEKVVIFIHQKEIAEKILANYPKAVSVRGDDNMEQRDKSVTEFQKCKKCNIKLEYHNGISHEFIPSDTQLIICSIKAAGVGITLTAASRVAFVELPWHAADTEQCEDRCHRISQKGSVQCTYFLGKDTIDEKIYQIIEEKRKISDEITGSVNDIEINFVDKFVNLFLNNSN